MSLLSATSFLPVFIIIIIAFISARLMVRDTAVLKSHAFVNIDGLRGVLAILVFIHQSVYWFNYSHSQQWSFYGSATYLSFGQASSCLFFMLSGFLFGHQLLESRNKEKEIDWLGFFYARIIRLAPLYLVCIFAMLVIVAFEAGFIQFEDTAILRSNIIDWLVFAIPGHPNINTNGNITLAFSGTIWILAYQWFFYLCLPLIALLVGSKSRSHSGIWLIISCLCVASFSRWGLDASLFYGFAGGGFAAYAVRTPWLH